MGFRFRRSAKILPGVKLNFSKSGVSTTIGRRGAGVTVGKRGAWANVGVPGSGMSYRERLDLPGMPARGRSGGSRAAAWIVGALVLLWLLSMLGG
jgi:hypothetical protein